MLPLYEHRVKEQFRRVEGLAEQLRDRFQAGVSSAELIREREMLAVAFAQLDALLPEAVTRAELPRHLYWIEYWLNRDEPDNCRADAASICHYDLPTIERSFEAWAEGRDRYDPELVEKLRPLLEERNLDSAIRKAFVILKERMVDVFGLSPDLDGSELVNTVFGKKGSISGEIPEAEREALRNLLDGLYGTFRNPASHRDIRPTWWQAEATLSTVNWALKHIEAYRRESKASEVAARPSADPEGPTPRRE